MALMEFRNEIVDFLLFRLFGEAVEGRIERAASASADKLESGFVSCFDIAAIAHLPAASAVFADRQLFCKSARVGPRESITLGSIAGADLRQPVVSTVTRQVGMKACLSRH